MSDQLESDLRRHFDDQTSHLPTTGPGLPSFGDALLAVPTVGRRPSPFVFAAAASLVVLAVGGLFLLAGRTGSDGTSTADGSAPPSGVDVVPAATLPDAADVSPTPVTVAGSEPADWYRLAPDLDVAWFQPLDGSSPSMFCWRTPLEPDGECIVDAVGALVVPLVVRTAGGQTLVLAGGERSEPTVEVTLDDGSTMIAVQDFDDIIDWGVGRLELPAARSVVQVDGQAVSTQGE